MNPTVSDLLFFFCPLLDANEVPFGEDVQGQFIYNALEPRCINVPSLDASDTQSLAYALHEISHHERYCNGTPYYRLPHKQPIERCIEEILTDKMAVYLTRQYFTPSHPICEEVATYLAKHTSLMIMDMVKYYQREEAPAEYIRYELGELLKEVKPQFVDHIVNCVISHI